MILTGKPIMNTLICGSNLAMIPSATSARKIAPTIGKPILNPNRNIPEKSLNNQPMLSFLKTSIPGPTRS